MLTLRQLIDRFLTFVHERQAEGTWLYYRHWLEQFLTHAGDMPVVNVRRCHLMEFAKNWWQVQTVQRLFRWACVEMQIIEADPFSGVKRPPLGNRRRVLTRREVTLLQRGAEFKFRAFLLALTETAARPQEIRIARWDQLRDAGGMAAVSSAIANPGGWLELSDFKARTRRSNPNSVRVLFLTDRMRRLLGRLLRRAKDKTGEIFLNRDGGLWNRNSLRCRMRRLRAKLGMVADGTGENIVLYSLRHSAATELAAAGIGEHALADVLGHTSTRTTQRYVHLQRDTLRRVFHESRCKARMERRR